MIDWLKYVTLLASIIAHLLGINGTDFDNRFACWESFNHQDMYRYVCLYDAPPEGTEMDEQDDPRQVFVGITFAGELRVKVDWWGTQLWEPPE